MLKTAVTAAIALVCMIVSAEARQRHRSNGLHPMCNITMPCQPMMDSATVKENQRVARGNYVARQFGIGGPVERKAKPKRHVRAAVRASKAPSNGLKVPSSLSYGAPSPSIGYSIGKPMRFIAGKLICALNVNAALAERGIQGTGSAWAKSYLRWGRSAGGPVPGAVIVSSRRGGGHVAIVSRVENGVVYAWNATGGQRDWQEIPYRHRVIDYRVPG